jgi:hypothetical protein
MIINKEDFEAWLASPVTEEVFSLLKAKADTARWTWNNNSWYAGTVDPLLLADLRARAEALIQVTEIDFETLEEANEKSDS